MTATTWVEADCDNGCAPLPNSTCCPTCDPPDSWLDRVACAEQTIDLFFGGQTADKLAVRICATCTVRPYCLEKGWEEDYGVWGGLTDTQRIKIRDLLQLDRVSRRQRRRTIRELASRPLNPR